MTRWHIRRGLVATMSNLALDIAILERELELLRVEMGLIANDNDRGSVK